MKDSEEGIRILTDKPRIRSDILPNLLNLPPNSLGHNYASFMKRNKISPDSRTEVRFVDDTELAYVMTRLILLVLLVSNFTVIESYET